MMLSRSEAGSREIDWVDGFKFGKLAGARPIYILGGVAPLPKAALFRLRLEFRNGFKVFLHRSFFLYDAYLVRK